HDTIFRLNNAPTVGFERHVGSRTTHRLVNNQWSSAYIAAALSEKQAGIVERLPLEYNLTVIMSRNDQSLFQSAVNTLKARRADLLVAQLAKPTITRAADTLAAVRTRLETLRGKIAYPGRGSPSSGFLATFLLMQMCSTVRVYGVGLGGCLGIASGGCQGSTSWHYWQVRCGGFFPLPALLPRSPRRRSG
ncbi:hypothetical protein CYMTET_33165, partial [Cymbomonas tetramitiformis]